MVLKVESEGTSISPRRPFSLTVILILWLLLACAGGLRLVGAVANWGLLLELGVQPGPVYLAVSGGVFGLLGLLLAWGFWKGFPWAGLAGRVAAFFYPLAYWLERLAFSRSPEAWSNWPFAAGVTLLWLAFAWWTLSRPSSRRFFAREGSSHTKGM